MKDSEIINFLYKIITIDGKGRREKARLLIELLDNIDVDLIKQELVKMLDLKY